MNMLILTPITWSNLKYKGDHCNQIIINIA